MHRNYSLCNKFSVNVIIVFAKEIPTMEYFKISYMVNI